MIFFELILHHATLLKVLFSCRSYLVKLFGSLMYAIVSSANSKSLISSFSSCIPLIFFCCFIALSRTIFNTYKKNRQLCLLLYFILITLSFAPFKLTFTVGLLYVAHIIFRYELVYLISS